MRSIWFALWFAIAVGLAPPVRASGFPGSCATGYEGAHSYAVWLVAGRSNFNGVVGYLAAAPSASRWQPCVGTGGMMWLGGADIQYGSNGIAQAGILRYSGDPAPWFAYTPIDDNHGDVRPATWFPQAGPIAGHEYFFMVASVHPATGYGWQYCIEDVTLVLRRCVTTPASFSRGTEVWDGGETSNTHDTMGAGAGTFQMFAPGYRLTTAAAWVHDTTHGCVVFGGPYLPAAYRCGRNAYRGYPGFDPYTS